MPADTPSPTAVPSPRPSAVDAEPSAVDVGRSGPGRPEGPALFEAVVNLCKRRGFVFPSAEIYGGIRSTYDYGPLGALMLRNVREAWWRAMVQERDDVVPIEAAILTNPKVWEASGHLATFTDPLVDCRRCKERWRADEVGDTCPSCGSHDLTEARPFNLLFKTFVGPVEDEASVAYLRPETAQGMFVNFLNVLHTTRKRPPFGVAQIGRSFRNEITPGNFVFRTREFEQMELEYFVPPAESARWFDYWCAERLAWYRRYGIPAHLLRLREHAKEELSHYSSGTADVEFLFPWGWGELEGIAQRSDYDLRAHSRHSGVTLEYVDQATGESYVPWVVEPAAGATRTMMAFLLAAYDEDVVAGERRTVLRLHPRLAPYQVAVLPLSRKEPLVAVAKDLLHRLQRHFVCDYDETQSIGRRYRRQDEVGTPLCVTVDFDSLEDGAVTIRERDSTAQVRLPIPEVAAEIARRLGDEDSPGEAR
jgi:glycyl-tRNA synthetase